MRVLLISLLTATATIYLAMVVWSLPYIASEADGLLPFDLRPFGYSLADAQAFNNALSEEGRVFYLKTQLLLDLFFPPLLALSLVLVAFIFWRGVARWAIIFLATVGVVSDWTENVLVAQILSSFGEELVRAASIWTVSKSISTTFVFGLIIALLGARIWQRVRA